MPHHLVRACVRASRFATARSMASLARVETGLDISPFMIASPRSPVLETQWVAAESNDLRAIAADAQSLFAVPDDAAAVPDAFSVGRCDVCDRPTGTCDLCSAGFRVVSAIREVPQYDSAVLRELTQHDDDDAALVDWAKIEEDWEQVSRPATQATAPPLPPTPAELPTFPLDPK